METPFFRWIAGWEKLVKLVKLAFWKNSIGHRDTINLMLFCLSNRYSPHLITKRLLLSNLGPCESRKDSTQIEFVVNYAKTRETITNFCIEQPTEPVNTILWRCSSKTKKIKKKSWEKKKPCNAGHKTGSLRSHQRKKDIFSILVDTCNGKLVASQLDNHAPVRNKIVTLRPKSPWFILEIKEQKAKCRWLEIRWRETRLTADREIYMQRCAVIQGIIRMFLINSSFLIHFSPFDWTEFCNTLTHNIWILVDLLLLTWRTCLLKVYLKKYTMLVLKGHVNPKIQVYPVLCKKVFLKTILQLFFANSLFLRRKHHNFYGRLTSG